MSANTTRLIPLTQGQFAIVDAADYDRLSQWHWLVAKESRSGNKYYVYRHIKLANGKYKRRPLANEVLGVDNSVLVDHINRNPLNNTKLNLRPATQSQNQFNRSIGKNNTSGHKGVVWDKLRNKWYVALQANHRQVFVGRFINYEEAVERYNQAIINYHGEFAAF